MRSKYYVKKEEKRKEILCVSIIFKSLVFATNLNIKKKEKRKKEGCIIFKITSDSYAK